MSAWTCRQSDGKADQKIVPPRSRIPCWKGPGADSEEKREPVSDIDTGAVDSPKALDPNRPIREADIEDQFKTSVFDLRSFAKYNPIKVPITINTANTATSNEPSPPSGEMPK